MIFIGYDYPPITTPGAVRAARLLPKIAEMGWNMDIVTVGDSISAYMVSRDERMEELFHKVTRVDDPLVRMVSTATNAGMSSSRRSPLRRLVEYFVFPDRTIFWAIAAIRQLRMVEIDADVVYSTSSSASAHLIGRYLSPAAKCSLDRRVS